MTTYNSSRPRLSQVDAPHPPTPPSPVLSASQSWVSGEIPIFLEPSPSDVTVQVSAAASTTSLFTSAGSVGTFGQPVHTARRSAGTQSRVSWVSYGPLHDGGPESSGSRSSSFSVQESEDEGCYGTEEKSIFSLSASLSSVLVYGSSDDQVSRGHYQPLMGQPSESDDPSSRLSLVSPQKRKCPKVNGLAHPALQPSRALNLDLHAKSDPDVPLSPRASTLLLSPVSSTVSDLVDSVLPLSQQQHLPAVSAPLVEQSLGTMFESCNTQSPTTPSLQLCTRPRSNSNPQVTSSLSPIHSKITNISEYLHNMRINLWIDQEGFRAIQPRLELMSFSHGTGINAARETLDVAEFAMRRRSTWYFHYAPLDSPPVLRRLTVNGDMNDYISRQAALSLKENGVYAVESTEGKGRVAWKFEYRIEDRRAPGSGKIIDGEKRFTPLRFVCNPTLLSAEHGKKVKLLQFVRKSVTPKLQSVLLCPKASAMVVPRIVVREGRASEDTVPGTRSESFLNKPDRPDVTIMQPLTADDREEPNSTSDAHLGSAGGQHIMSPSALNAMFPVPSAETVASEGLPPPPRSGKRAM